MGSVMTIDGRELEVSCASIFASTAGKRTVWSLLVISTSGADQLVFFAHSFPANGRPISIYRLFR